MAALDVDVHGPAPATAGWGQARCADRRRPRFQVTCQVLFFANVSQQAVHDTLRHRWGARMQCRLASLVRRLSNAVGFSPRGHSAADARRAAVLVCILFRGVCLVEMLVGVTSGLRASRIPAVYATASVGVFVLSVGLAAAYVRHGQIQLRLGLVDWCSAVVGLVVCATTLPPHLLLGTWAAWAGGYAVSSAAAAGLWAPSLGTALAASVSLGGVYFAAYGAAGVRDTGSLWANALVHPMYGLVAAVLYRYVMRLALNAEEANARAAESARQAERDRYRLAVHDVAGILGLLSRDSLPAATLVAVREQALQESNRLRQYLGDRRAARAERRCIGDALLRASATFTDLPIELLIDIGAPTQLQPEVLEKLERAVFTLLHNVRQHAGASLVVIHADARHHRWEVTVNDDGVGFDPGGVELGFGLSVQVRQELEAAGMTVAIDSSPGEGTRVSISGFAAESADV